MRCKEMENLSIKYELGEIDFFNKMRFEYHLKRCSVCKKKYISILILGTLLCSSTKTYTPNFLKLFFSSELIKYTLLGGLILTSGIGINQVYQKEKINLQKNGIEKNVYKESKNEKIKTKNILEKEMKKEQEGFKIIAVDGDKEVEIIFDKNHLQKSRIEK